MMRWSASSLFLGTFPGWGASACGALNDRLSIVDTHTHFYDPHRTEGVPWPEPESPLYRTVLPKHWRQVAEPLGVAGTVVVEASEWLEDNQWILDLAEAEPTILGFVGNLSVQDERFSEHLERFAPHPLFLGIRLRGEWTPHINSPEFQAGIRLLLDRDLQIDVNGDPEVHKHTVHLARRFPELRIVIDHVGGAGDPQKLSSRWKKVMSDLAQYPNVYCKVSALIEQTEASNQRWGEAPRELEYYLPTLDFCWEFFGEDRLLYGSNWPVSDKGGTYADQFRLVDEYFTSKGKTVREKFFIKNAIACYRWTRPIPSL